MTHLLSISIGPVQEFIAASRKTADLRAGSQLLLAVVNAAAQTFTATERIFPTGTGGGANKILARIQDDPAQRAQAAKGAAQAELRRLWAQYVPDAWAEQPRAKAQLEHFLEFYAAWTPEQGNYAASRHRVEQLLAGRKALRDFAPFDQQDAGLPKSPLDPAYATVFQGAQVPEQLPGYKPSEVLDAVSLLKREWGRKPGRDVLNTHTLAHRVLNTHTLAHRARVPGAPNHPGDNFTPAYPYFAILVADGDNMGAKLSADDQPEKHRAFSQQLDAFAVQAAKIVAQHDGYPIYTGGDDVLALLPVTQALECGEALRQAFLTETGCTLSAGIAIVHYREPLSTSLQRARDAEKAAKRLDGKNAVSVALHTRGGVPTAVTLPWQNSGFLRCSVASAAGSPAHELPRGLPYELRELARQWPANFQSPALGAEVQRLARRKDWAGAVWGGVTPPPLETADQLTQFADQLVLARFLTGQGDQS